MRFPEPDRTRTTSGACAIQKLGVESRCSWPHHDAHLHLRGEVGECDHRLRVGDRRASHDEPHRRRRAAFVEQRTESIHARLGDERDRHIDQLRVLEQRAQRLAPISESRGWDRFVHGAIISPLAPGCTCEVRHPRHAAHRADLARFRGGTQRGLTWFVAGPTAVSADPGQLRPPPQRAGATRQTPSRSCCFGLRGALSPREAHCCTPEIATVRDAAGGAAVAERWQQRRATAASL